MLEGVVGRSYWKELLENVGRRCLKEVLEQGRRLVEVERGLMR